MRVFSSEIDVAPFECGGQLCQPFPSPEAYVCNLVLADGLCGAVTDKGEGIAALSQPPPTLSQPSPNPLPTLSFPRFAGPRSSAWVPKQDSNQIPAWPPLPTDEQLNPLEVAFGNLSPTWGNPGRRAFPPVPLPDHLPNAPQLPANSPMWGSPGRLSSLVSLTAKPDVLPPPAPQTPFQPRRRSSSLPDPPVNPLNPKHTSVWVLGPSSPSARPKAPPRSIRSASKILSAFNEVLGGRGRSPSRDDPEARSARSRSLGSAAAPGSTHETLTSRRLSRVSAGVALGSDARGRSRSRSKSIMAPSQAPSDRSRTRSFRSASRVSAGLLAGSPMQRILRSTSRILLGRQDSASPKRDPSPQRPNASGPPQAVPSGSGSTSPRQSMPGPGPALPRQSMPGPGPALPRQSMPGPGPALPRQSMPGPGPALPRQSFAFPQQSIPGPGPALARQQSMPGPGHTLPRQSMPGPGPASPRQRPIDGPGRAWARQQSIAGASPTSPRQQSMPGPALAGPQSMPGPGPALAPQQSMPGPALAPQQSMPIPGPALARHQSMPGAALARQQSMPGPALARQQSMPGPASARQQSMPGAGHTLPRQSMPGPGHASPRQRPIDGPGRASARQQSIGGGSPASPRRASRLARSAFPSPGRSPSPQRHRPFGPPARQSVPGPSPGPGFGAPSPQAPRQGPTQGPPMQGPGLARGGRPQPLDAAQFRQHVLPTAHEAMDSAAAVRVPQAARQPAPPPVAGSALASHIPVASPVAGPRPGPRDTGNPPNDPVPSHHRGAGPRGVGPRPPGHAGLDMDLDMDGITLRPMRRGTSTRSRGRLPAQLE